MAILSNTAGGEIRQKLKKYPSVSSLVTLVKVIPEMNGVNRSKCVGQEDLMLSEWR